MKNVHVVGSKMTRNDGKMVKLIGCAFHFETEFRSMCERSESSFSVPTPACYVMTTAAQQNDVLTIKGENYSWKYGIYFHGIISHFLLHRSMCERNVRSESSFSVPTPACGPAE